MQKEVFPPGELHFPSGDEDFPPGESIFPSGESLFPGGENIFPSGEIVLPAGESDFPLGESIFPAGESHYPRGEIIPPSGYRPVPLSYNPLMRRRWKALVVGVVVIAFAVTVAALSLAEDAENRSRVLSALGTETDMVLFRSHVDSGNYSGVTRFASYAIVRFQFIEEAQKWRGEMAQRCPPGFELSMSEVFPMEFKNERKAIEEPWFAIVVQLTRARGIAWYDFGQWFD